MSLAGLLGGLFIGVLSALPIVSAANCCCLWIISGGVIAAYFAQQEDPRPLGLLDGARVGFRAALFGALVWLLASIVINRAVAPLQGNTADLVLRNATDMPPEVRDWLESLGNNTGAAALVGGFLFQLFIATPFASLGGLLGAALFGRTEQPQEQ
jgi:hypothetical protein